MISKISFPKRTARKSNSRHRNEFDYIAEVPTVNGKTFSFKPGLNILLGMNGSGKSTVLKACALSLAAYQGGVSTVTKSWCHQIYGFDGDSIIIPWKIKHDGQPIYFVDPRISIGLSSGAFDEDFFNQGLVNTVARASTGEKTLQRLDHVVKVIMGNAPMPDKIQWRMDKGNVNDSWRKKLESAEIYLSGSVSIGQQTVLLDEPESYLSLPFQVGLWKRVLGEDPSRFNNIQVIIASHSPFAFDMPHAHYIEMTPGYIKQCEESLEYARGLTGNCSKSEVEKHIAG